MKILMIVTSMKTGGVQSSVRDLAAALSFRGHHVAVLSLCHEDVVATDESVLRFSLQMPGLTGLGAPTAARRAREVIDKFSPDVIHGHALHGNLVAVLAAAGTGIPVVATLHSVREGNRLHGLIGRLSRRRAARVVAVSRAVALAHHEERASVITNAIDLERFKFSCAQRAEVRGWLGAHDDTVYLMVGRLTVAKNIPYLLRSFALHLDRERATASHGLLVIAGDGELRGSLVALAGSLGLASRVRFLGERSDVPALLSAADVYVQSSSWEGFPIAPLEAKASGLPVIATDVGGTKEIEPQPEFLVSSGDEAQLAEAMFDASVRGRPEEDRAHAIAGLGHYSTGNWVQLWESQYLWAVR